MGNLSQIERTFGNHEWRLDKLDRDNKRLKQQGGGGGGTPWGSSGGGGAWAYAAVVTAGGSATLNVWEVRAAGDIDMGEQTVLNRYNQDTDASAGNLILVKNPDGSYLIVGQGCKE